MAEEKREEGRRRYRRREEGEERKRGKERGIKGVVSAKEYGRLGM